MTLPLITSVQNQRVKDAVKLRDHRQRVRQKRFAIDGAREILRALAGRVHCVEAFVCEAMCSSDDSAQALEAMRQLGIPLWPVTEPVFEKLAFGHRHEGLLAIAETRHRALADLKISSQGLVAVLDGLEKPGNVGAILRSADAAGVTAVIVVRGRTDLFNPNCIRASLGTVFTQPVCEASLEEARAWLRQSGRTVYVAHLDAEQSYLDARLGDGAAIILGSEAQGVAGGWMGDDVRRIKLPMLGVADSLNVSATAAVLFYEALRQQSAKGT